ncbi:MAG TPA: ribonuclease J [Candidatus Scatomorpha pullistercoris]|uniref:Ribonuclease J n=1 Tax=Candidatus Scatomorpha pullistercoris TaxID=2840929 RepID=A0A9D1K7N7_9FIRM|nr:ribonuclease J [Candidatus Scatomorpha pullistercoris]
MAKLKIIPLGGLGEIGKNLTVYEYGQDIVVVDCGLGFPDEELYGIDVVIPDITYLKQNKDKIRGIVITHGHEDHIGALPYVMRELDVPIYATSLTAGIIELKLEEFDLLYNTQIFTKKPGDRFKLGCFEIEFIHVNHSIADSVALAIKTPIGTVLHTGDFKIDVTPIQGEMIDLARIGQLGKQGILALLSDSTNVERPGHTESERKVAEKFDELFKGCEKRIIVTTFASNVQRIQQIVNVAAKYKRKVAVTGRSMENMIKVAIELGYMDIPEGVLVDLNQIKGQPKDRTVIISTGSQGESMSALYRMAFSEHKQINIDAGDRIIISASAIPGNENTISKVIDELFHKGAEVIYDRHTDLHVSGHASQEEQKMMLALTKPKFFIPIHGEYRMLCKHAELGRMMGVAPNNIVIAENGRVIELSRRSVKAQDSVPAGRVFVDGTGVGDVGSVVLRDRKHLAQDGMIVVVLTLSGEDSSLMAPPEIVTRGFIYEKESDGLMEEMRRVINESLASCRHQRITDWAGIKNKVRTNLTGYLYKATKRSPMIIPVITEL